MTKPTASAVVTLTIEVNTAGSYGPEWTVQQIHEQVTREAKNFVRNVIDKQYGRVVGEPVVKGVRLHMSGEME